MSKITSSIGYTKDLCWIEQNQHQIQDHPAWKEVVDLGKIEALLRGKPPFTYLLRKGEQDLSYFITFIKQDQSIKHQHFTLEMDLKGWYYRNGSADSPVLIVAEALEDLIPQMMRCNPSECKILTVSERGNY